MDTFRVTPPFGGVGHWEGDGKHWEKIGSGYSQVAGDVWLQFIKTEDEREDVEVYDEARLNSVTLFIITQPAADGTILYVKDKDYDEIAEYNFDLINSSSYTDAQRKLLFCESRIGKRAVYRDLDWVVAEATVKDPSPDYWRNSSGGWAILNPLDYNGNTTWRILIDDGLTTIFQANCLLRRNYRTEKQGNIYDYWNAYEYSNLRWNLIESNIQRIHV